MDDVCTAQFDLEAVNICAIICVESYLDSRLSSSRRQNRRVLPQANPYFATSTFKHGTRLST